jgi:tetratricopeptide (TPR) repeat protein
LGALRAARAHKGDAEAALKLFRQARVLPSDISVQYLSYLFEGRILEEQGHATDAIAAYRAALDLVPSAGSARLALSALTYLGGDTHTANDLIQEMLALPASAEDPWALYRYADYRNWPARVQALRQAIR